MNKTLKYKKLIVFICLFTFLFLPLQMPKKVNALENNIQTRDAASAVIIGGVGFASVPTGVILASAGLALACGVVITNPDMVVDVGNRVFETLNKIPGALEVVGEKIKVNANSFVKDTVLGLLKDLPKEDVELVKTESFEDLTKVGSFFSYRYVNGQRINYKTGSVTFIPTGDYATSGYLEVRFGSSTLAREYWPLNVPVSVSWHIGSQTASVWINGKEYVRNVSSSDTNNYVAICNPTNYTNKFNITGHSAGTITSIPYTPTNSSSVSSDTYEKYFPSNTGTITYPLDTPYTGHAPTVDVPYTKPTDILGEGDISIDVPAVDNPSIDMPADTPVTGEGLWDTLMGWLSKLFAPVVELLKLLADLLAKILSAITGFVSDLVSSLVGALTGALEKLFVPTVALDELFKVPSGSGFAQIVDFFNWDSLWNITPQPYKFSTSIPITDLTGSGASKTWDININLFDNEVMKDNINLVRNVLSYSVLITTVWFVIHHFLPNRDMD